MSLVPLFCKKSKFHIFCSTKKHWMAFFIDSSCILDSSEGFQFLQVETKWNGFSALSSFIGVLDNLSQNTFTDKNFPSIVQSHNACRNRSWDTKWSSKNIVSLHPCSTGWLKTFPHGPTFGYYFISWRCCSRRLCRKLCHYIFHHHRCRYFLRLSLWEQNHYHHQFYWQGIHLLHQNTHHLYSMTKWNLQLPQRYFVRQYQRLLIGDYLKSDFAIDRNLSLWQTKVEIMRLSIPNI